MSVALSLIDALPSAALAADRGGVPAALVDGLPALPLGIRLRYLSPADKEALVRMVDRTSPQSRQGRFHEPLAALPPGWARAISNVTGRRVAVAAVVEGIDHRLANQPDAALGAPFDDEVVALAQVEPEVGGAELAVLVEDAYQRTGLGLVVVCVALVEVARSGVPRVRAHILPGNDGIRRLLSALELPVRRGHDDGKECWTLDISSLSGGAAPMSPVRPHHR